MEVTDISLNGLNGIRSREGRALRAYQDSVGVWTIGYGITNYDKGIGFKVGPGVTLTEDQAEELLYSSLRRNYMPEVERVLDTDQCEHPQGAFDGGLSFHYNTGAIGRASWPHHLMAGDLDSARVSLESWNRAGGRVLRGLTLRREWEWGVISEEDYGRLTGPAELDTRGHIVGTGDLLTAVPGHADPNVVRAVLTDLPPTRPPEADAPLTSKPDHPGVNPKAGHIKLNGLPFSSTPSPGALALGSSGPGVAAVQHALNIVGHPTPVTGNFDSDTYESVKAFQATHPHVTADGTVGPATSSALVRHMDMQDKVKSVTGVAAGSAVGADAAWQWLSTHSALLISAGLAAVAVAALGYIVWNYRGEVAATINGITGRAVL
jgi:lysozyme